VDQTPELAFEKINEEEPLIGHKININSRYGAVHEASANHTKDTRKETNGEIIKFSSVRLVNKDGSLNIKRVSVFKTPYLRDYFHTLVNGPWSRVLLVFTISFAFMALIFGVLLFLERDGLAGNGNKTFGDIYFFSLEIMTTITFGDFIPSSVLSKLIFASETFLYTIFQACIFAIFTTKFAQAQSSAASIIFSEKAIITQKDNSHFFVFRIANLRKHQFLDVRMRVFAISETQEDDAVKFIPLKLNFEETIPFLGLPWTVIHKIDSKSPLRGYSKNNFQDVQLVVFMEGIDSSTSNSFQARYSYKNEDIVWDATFVKAVYKQNGTFVVDFKKFHEYETHAS